MFYNIVFFGESKSQYQHRFVLVYLYMESSNLGLCSIQNVKNILKIKYAITVKLYLQWRYKLYACIELVPYKRSFPDHFYGLSMQEI